MGGKSPTSAAAAAAAAPENNGYIGVKQSQPHGEEGRASTPTRTSLSPTSNRNSTNGNHGIPNGSHDAGEWGDVGRATDEVGAASGGGEVKDMESRCERTWE